MIYTGYMRPFELRLANNLELINDTCIVVSSYFLIIFSALVADPEARYISGWPCIMIVCFIIGLNLSVMTLRGVGGLARAIKLRYLRNKKRKIMAERVKKNTEGISSCQAKLD